MKKIAIIMALGLATSLQSYAKGPSSFEAPNRPDTKNRVEKVEVKPDQIVKTYTPKEKVYGTATEDKNELRSIVLTKNAGQVKIQVCDEYNKESQVGVNCEVIGEGQWNSKEIDQLVNVGTVKPNRITALPSAVATGVFLFGKIVLFTPVLLTGNYDHEKYTLKCFHLYVYTGEEDKTSLITPSYYTSGNGTVEEELEFEKEARKVLSDMNQDMSQGQSGTYVYNFEEENFSDSDVDQAKVFGEALGFISSVSLNKLVCTHIGN